MAEKKVKDVVLCSVNDGCSVGGGGESRAH